MDWFWAVLHFQYLWVRPQDSCIRPNHPFLKQPALATANGLLFLSINSMFLICGNGHGHERVAQCWKQRKLNMEIAGRQERGAVGTRQRIWSSAFLSTNERSVKQKAWDHSWLCRLQPSLNIHAIANDSHFSRSPFPKDQAEDLQKLVHRNFRSSVQHLLQSRRGCEVPWGPLETCLGNGKTIKKEGRNI